MNLSKKKYYLQPEAEIEWFSINDTITTSSIDDGDEPGLPDDAADYVGAFGKGTDPDF